MLMRTLIVAFGLLTTTCLAAPQDRETKVRNDRKNVEADDHWIYNDLERGIAEAKQGGKPLLVVFRCVPCEACSKFDDQVVRRDPVVRELMDRYVCVRVVHANGMDLARFQFDYDQSLAAFLMHPDKTIYARFGTRSHHHDETQDMTMEGFRKALVAGLELHQQYPAKKDSLAGKQGRPVKVKSPEDYPSLSGKYGSKLDYEGNVVKSCIHCHQVREAQRLVYREAKQPMPDEVLYPYPLPTVVGLEMDAREMATIKTVQPGSSAQRDGFQAGDKLVTLSVQPMLSIADVQWVLHNAGATDKLPAKIQRGGQQVDLVLTLDEGWRKRQDISWRPTTWDLRRMASGGLTLESLPEEERSALKIAADQPALRVKTVGQYGAHAVAKQAGFQQGDVILAVDGQPAPRRETDFLAMALNRKNAGDRLAVTILRDGQKRELTLPQQ
jgi:hypothetical protein